jgi:hypothetical protein
MGCACLRGDGHHWPAGRAGRANPRGRQTAGLTHQPDAAGSHACAQLLRRRGDADAVRLGEPENQPDADSNSDTVGIGQPIRDGDRQRLGDSLPVAHRDDITVTERLP